MADWIKPEEYSKNKVDRAGKILVGRKTKGYAEAKETLNIFNNWRASHAYPMHIIMLTLRNISKKIHPEAICVQRLKRAKSIIKKLDRFPQMQLSRIQDIGGCRAVLPNVTLARKVAEEYIGSKLRHKRVKARGENYINFPKPDGYRSIHLVYKYYSINKVGKAFNNKLIEIQIRSKLQHIWATALETVDLFTSQTMKFGGGKENWKYFFKLVSSAFAIMEKCPQVPGTPINKKELYSEIERMAKELNVFDRMIAWRSSMKHLSKKKGSLFLLRLDMKKKGIYITTYKNDSKGREKASEDYSIEEETYRTNENCDVVLVGAESIKDLRDAYPNYFADTEDFLKKLSEILNTY